MLKRERKIFAIGYLVGICSQCKNEYHPAIFEFHHKDPSSKVKDPSKLLNGSLSNLVKELEKCILVCANCHRLIHNEENY